MVMYEYSPTRLQSLPVTIDENTEEGIKEEDVRSTIDVKEAADSEKIDMVFEGTGS